MTNGRRMLADEIASTRALAYRKLEWIF